MPGVKVYLKIEIRLKRMTKKRYKIKEIKLNELKVRHSCNMQKSVAYAEICKGGGFGAENVIALSSPGNGQKLPKLGLHSKIKCFGFKNILQ